MEKYLRAGEGLEHVGHAGELVGVALGDSVELAVVDAEAPGAVGLLGEHDGGVEGRGGELRGAEAGVVLSDVVDDARPVEGQVPGDADGDVLGELDAHRLGVGERGSDAGVGDG